MEKRYYTLTEATARLKTDAIELGERGLLAMAYRRRETSNTERTGFVIEHIKPGWEVVDFLYVTAAQFRKVVNAARTQDRAILRDTFTSLEELADADEIIKRRNKGSHFLTEKLFLSGVKVSPLYAGLDDIFVTTDAMQAYEAISTRPSGNVQYFQLMNCRLKPLTQFTGGRVTGTDVLTVSEAASMATKHAGQTVSVSDFLRAAGRGEISLEAIIHRTTKVQSYDGGVYCNAGQENENIATAGAVPTLPLTACQHLATTGRASWRTFDGFEMRDGVLCRYTKGILVPGEPDFETVPDDCRVTGYAVHALADAFKETDTQTQAAQALPAAPEAVPVVPVPGSELTPVTTGDIAHVPTTWTLRKPKRFQGYTEPLYLLLGKAHSEGKPRPRAREVLQAWAANLPAQIAKVIEGESLDYYLEKGGTKTANLRAIAAAITEMTGKSQN